MESSKNSGIKNIFDGVTPQGKEEMEIILNMLIDGWIDELARAKGTDNEKKVEERSVHAISEIKKIKESLVAKPTKKREYTLANIVDSYKIDQSIGISKNILVKLNFNGKDYEIQTTSWCRSYTELVKQVFLIDPAFLQVMSLQSNWKLTKSKSGFKGEIDVFGGYYIDARGSFLAIIEKIKKVVNNILGLKHNSVKVVIW